MSRQSLYCIIKSASLINVQMDGQIHPIVSNNVTLVNLRPASYIQIRDIRNSRLCNFALLTRSNAMLTRVFYRIHTLYDQIEGGSVSKSSLGAIRNIPRGELSLSFSLHYCTLNICFIVIGSKALIGNTRG